MSGDLVAMGRCWSCRQLFGFDPDAVPSVPIDPLTNLPPDLGGDPARAVNQPICPVCVGIVNPLREAAGLPPMAEGPT